MAKKHIEQLFKEIENIGNQLDWRNKDSIISKIDKDGNLILPENFYQLFTKIEYYYNYTEGYFNPFLRNLVIKYNNFESNTNPPSKIEIEDVLNSIKKSKFIKDKNSNLVIEVVNAENLDLGAAVAGFLVDYSFDFLKSKGYKNFLINGSGEIRVSGNKFGKNWLIGIQSPFSSSIIDSVYLKDGYSISTSGSYERFFIYNNQKYHHILNPFTGMPDSKFESVTILTKDSCLAADILSTAVFAMGIEKGMKFCEDKNIEYYIIYSQNNDIVIKKSSFFSNKKKVKLP